MKDNIDYIAELFGFLNDVIDYLHSWLCTRNGKYMPFDKKLVGNMVMKSLAQGNSVIDVINSFKNGVKDGTILIGVLCIGLTDEKREELYEIYSEIKNKLETKYHYEED